jgi:hypothetical protein
VNPRASARKNPRGGENHPWVACVDGAEIMGITFARKQEAVTYAERVAEWWPPGTFDEDGRGVAQRWWRPK